MKISFAPPYITEDEINEVVNVLKSNWLSMGEKTVEFEKKFAEYIGTKYAVSLNSCTAGLFLSLKVLGIKKGDEIITTPFTFAATANVIVHNGAIPVFVDISERDFNIDASKIEEKITPKTKAIIPVHYAGNPSDMDEIMKISKEYDLSIIEDAAHAAGSEYKRNKKVGSLGNLTSFSFYATKPLTTGEGGMITLNDPEIYEKLKILRLHGISKDAWDRYTQANKWYYEIVEAGYKFNTTDINSALGLSQLKKLDWMNEKRREIANYYLDELANLNSIELPYYDQNLKLTYHLFPIRIKKYNRDKFIKKMADFGIGTSVHFIPLHLMPYYKNNFGYRKGDFPIAEKVYREIVSLPIYPHLKTEELEYIVRTIKKILNQ